MDFRRPVFIKSLEHGTKLELKRVLIFCPRASSSFFPGASSHFNMVLSLIGFSVVVKLVGSIESSGKVMIPCCFDQSWFFKNWLAFKIFQAVKLPPSSPRKATSSSRSRPPRSLTRRAPRSWESSRRTRSFRPWRSSAPTSSVSRPSRGSNRFAGN